VGVIYLDIEVLAASQPTIFPATGPIVFQPDWTLDPNYDYAKLQDPSIDEAWRLREVQIRKKIEQQRNAALGVPASQWDYRMVRF
jgi:hypothetical protein